MRSKLTTSLRGSFVSPRSPLAAAPSRLSLYLSINQNTGIRPHGSPLCNECSGTMIHLSRMCLAPYLRSDSSSASARRMSSTLAEALALTCGNAQNITSLNMMTVSGNRGGEAAHSRCRPLHTDSMNIKNPSVHATDWASSDADIV